MKGKIWHKFHQWISFTLYISKCYMPRHNPGSHPIICRTKKIFN
uniref:Uncharacterized protein n=1 Tax=Anguilla anguilla TaxID=7936 RepID=A0A0E9V6K0_ANGAN